MYCPECGTEIDDCTSYCPKCGTSIDDDPTPSEPSPDTTDSDSDERSGWASKIPLMTPGSRGRNIGVGILYAVIILAALGASAPSDTGDTTAPTAETNGGAATPGAQNSGVQVRVIYDGEWQGSVGSEGGQRSVDGIGEETIDIDDGATIVSANAQKLDGSSSELTIQILVDGEVVAEQSTTAAHGVAQVSENI